MTRDVIIGIDAGTSLIKAVAFSRGGEQLAMAARSNSYAAGAGGRAEQDVAMTWRETVATLLELVEGMPEIRDRACALAITGQGDGTWLIDADGEPVMPALLWLDSRAADETRRVREHPEYGRFYETTGTGAAPCQQSSQLAWLARHSPQALARATTAFHCKDWLYFRLTSKRATDPSEGVWTFGDFRTRRYHELPLRIFELNRYAGLLPPIVDGTVTSHPLTAAAATQVKLPQGLPVVLGYVDVICTALGGGLFDPTIRAGLSVIGSTGVHLKYASAVDEVRLGANGDGYTICFPVPGTWTQMHSNLSATLNIDWLLDVMRDALAEAGISCERRELVPAIDRLTCASSAGRILYHPYISAAGERGPFLAPQARASFTGLDSSTGLAELTRAVLEGLAMAARDCFSAMGEIPEEVRVAGGAARSNALRSILAAVLDRPLRTFERDEAGASGAAMIAAVQQRLYPDMAACAADWVEPYRGDLVRPDPALALIYANLFPLYVETRQALAPLWSRMAELGERR